MRVLLAIDGSISSDRARDLVASLALPAGSHVRVVGVIEHGSELFGLPWMPGVSNDTGTIEPAPTDRFVEELDLEIKLMRRDGHPSSLLMLDLDNLKQVNDALGGPLDGDAVARLYERIMDEARRIQRIEAERDKHDQITNHQITEPNPKSEI